MASSNFVRASLKRPRSPRSSADDDSEKVRIVDVDDVIALRLQLRRTSEKLVAARKNETKMEEVAIHHSVSETLF